MATVSCVQSDLLTRQQAAEFLGVKSQTLAVWALTGRHNLPYVKAGRVVRYRLRDLEKWLKNRTIGNAEV